MNSLKVSRVKLSLAEQLELGRRMTELGDSSARDALILNCVPVVITAAKGFSKHSQISYEDLFQEGMMGVMEAIDKYDYTKNTKFSSFAYFRIIHRLALWVKNQAGYYSSSPDNGRLDGALMDSTIESFQSVFQTHPTDSQLSKLLTIPQEDIPYLRKRYCDPIPSSCKIQFCDISKFDASSEGIDVPTIVEKKLCSMYNQEQIYAALQILEPLEREIVLRRYLYDEKKATLQEIASVHGVHPSTVLRRERQALNSILLYFKEKGIEPDL